MNYTIIDHGSSSLEMSQEFFSRPGVDGDDLQTASSLIHSVTGNNRPILF